MGVACDSEQEIAASLRAAEEAPWRQVVPPSTVLSDADAFELTLHLPPGTGVTARIRTESGADIPVEAGVRPTGRHARLRDGTERAEVVLPLPTRLPLGYHRVEVTPEGSSETAAGHLIVTPGRCPDPADLGRSWGWMLQLYALRSARSWGIGDLSDLATLMESGAPLGADFAVVNPLHAAAPVVPQVDSPYYPSSRRFTNPLYLAIRDVPEIADLRGAEAARVRELAAEAEGRNHADRIDRDAAFVAKAEALRLAHASMSPGRRQALEAYRRREGEPLENFATFCCLAETHGLPFQTWPESLRHPGAPAVASFRAAHADRVTYHTYLQFLCDEQLAVAQRAAVSSGARVGIVHDLAVGVDKGGADAWALQDALGLGVSVGAPPDAFNQQGQDWQQPPLLPNRLREQGYVPFRDMLRAVLRHGGGIRIDHIIGLFRLYWIPDDAPARDGTYVRYPVHDLLGVLALEATRAEAIVIGEDLGTVEPGVREELTNRSILSSSVLYFERDDADDDAPRRAVDYPHRSLASVTTHDLPTAAGWWSDEDVDVRTRLGLLAEGRSEDEERQDKASERERMEGLLADEGLLGEGALLGDRVQAMHAFLARTPAALVAVNVPDVVGDLRAPNLPGTVDEYPNWRLPIAEPRDGAHGPVTVERLVDHPGMARVAEAMRTGGRGR
jgi:4-alpha-glucanotransferase